MTSVRAKIWRRRVKETLDYAAWAYLPLKSWSTTRLYGLIGTDTVAQQGLYINLGYWKDARSEHRPRDGLWTRSGGPARARIRRRAESVQVAEYAA
jgi:hypothetical protein